MILLADGIEYIDDLVNIYNSAILLFKETERSNATSEIFLEQMKNDTNYIYFDEEGNANAFLSYHKYSENVYVLTSLYVSRDDQNKGVGMHLMEYFEEAIEKDSYIFVKVLKNAPWSKMFYSKLGYSLLDFKTQQIILKMGFSEKPWETILYKLIK